MHTCHSIFEFLRFDFIDRSALRAASADLRRTIAQRGCRFLSAQVTAAHVLAGRGQGKQALDLLGEVRERRGGIFGAEDTADHVQEGFPSAMLSEAAHGARGRLVVQAGSLLGVKEEGMVEQQAQDQASA